MPSNEKKLVDPVIIVPGITATNLTDEYPVSHESVWNVLRNSFDRVALHPDNLSYEAIEPARIRPGQIFEIAYKELIEELSYNLSEKEDLLVPVFPFGYDWRMPLETVEKELDSFISEVIGRTRLLRHYHEYAYDENPRVNLVGHSMGGLVITGYLANKKTDAPVNKVVTLATPYRGSFEAVMKIATGTADLGSAKQGSRERETARMTPALYHLLPMFRDGISIEPGIPETLFEPDSWQPTIQQSIAEFIRLKGLPTDDVTGKAEILFRSLLSQAESHGKKVNEFRLESAGLDANRWMAVVGVNAKTRVKLNIINKDGKADFQILTGDRDNQWSNPIQKMRRLTGDGTVPFEGAVPSFLTEENLICVTPEDYGYWELSDKSISSLAGFHGILPNMNMVHRLIVRFLKGTEDTRGSTWGRRSPGAENWNPPLKLDEKK